MALKDIVEAAESERTRPPTPAPRVPEVQAKRGRPRKLQTEPPPENSRAKSRVGKRALVGHFSPEMHKEVNRLAFDMDITLQALIGEALDDILQKYRRKTFGER